MRVNALPSCLRMLPRFPKAQAITDKARDEKMFEAMYEVFPPAIHPPVHPIIEGKTSDFQREDRQIKPLNIKRLQAKSQLDTSDGKGMTVQTLFAIARELGESMGKQKFDMLTGAISEAVEETGQEVKLKNGEITQEDILRLLAMGEESFDEAGNTHHQLLCGHKFADALKQKEIEWAEDKAFQEKVAAIREEKRRSFNEREARRRLVE